MTSSPAAYAELIANDLASFADIGTDAPTIEPTHGGYAIRFIRNGEVTELLVSENKTQIVETAGSDTYKHATFRALLASDRYGTLRDWAAKQHSFLSRELAEIGDLIDVRGSIDNGFSNATLQAVDDRLSAPQGSDSTRVLLIDGPAGIGKTQFIMSLSASRAANYNTERRPLILHVQSRGRTLSYIYDLIAFSLQRLRLEVTFDQVPILAKHGLITLAIDGFDELADPDGYDMAWAQVNDLVVSLRGAGSIVLAGRETFIGRDRIVKDIASLREDADDISVLTLHPPSKGDALQWLSGQGWSAHQLTAVEEFLEPSSLALRPFFLKTLSDASVAERIANTTSTSVLSILMEAMTEREVTKFGEAVDAELGAPERQNYVAALMGEVARDMAENSSASVSDGTLAWLVDIALPEGVSETARRILKARSQVLAFLTNDERPGYKRFYHEKFYEYFISKVLLSAVKEEQVIKPLARNILGTSLLETFGSVISGGTPAAETKSFLESGIRILGSYPSIDRTRRNIGTLLLSALAIADLLPQFALSEIEIDEARFIGTAANALLSNLVISQFDCRGADLSNVTFDRCVIFTLIADAETVLPASIPEPTRIQDISAETRGITNPEEIKRWIESHLRNPPERPTGLVPTDLRDHEAVRLLGKVCRMRQYWLRKGEDVHSTRILENPYWPILEKALQDNALLKEEHRQASGTNARFIHVRKQEEILQEDAEDEDIQNFYSEFVQALRDADL